MSHGTALRIHLTGLRSEVLIGALATVVAVDACLVAYAEAPGGFLNPTVDRISSVTWTVDGTAISHGPGLNTHPGAAIVLTLVDTNCYLGCAVLSFSNVTVSPMSFTLAGASLPLIPPGATGNLTVTVRTPSGGYSGPLFIDLS